MASPAVIGAVVGVLLGVVLLAVLVACIIYISKKLKKKTNARSKIISPDGRVIKDKWVEDEEAKKYYTYEDDNRMYFGHIDRTEHIEVKEKRKKEEIIIPPETTAPPAPPVPEVQPSPPPPPPPPAPIIPPPVPSPKPHKRLARYRVRSWPKRQREPPPVKRRASFGNAESTKYILYGVPYPVTSAAYASWMPAQPKPAPTAPPQATPTAPPALEAVPPARKCKSIEEQERVLVIDDTVTERSFNPRYTCRVSADVSDHRAEAVSQSVTTSAYHTCELHSQEVPKIVTELL